MLFFMHALLPEKENKTEVCLKCVTYNLEDDVEILCTVRTADPFSTSLLYIFSQSCLCNL